MPRYAILVEGLFNFLFAKTGNAILRYRTNEVACCVDSINAGKTTQEVVGIGGNVPIVSNLKEALKHNPDTLLVGVVTEGGYLPSNMRPAVSEAIKHRLDIICGLHHFLSEDPEFSMLANKYSVSITDLRKPPHSLPFSKGSWKKRTTPVLLTVGSDCDTGKMTAAWEIKNALKDRGFNPAFIGTGQTGILLGGSGVAVDAVVSDFVAGVIENEIDKIADNYDIIIVEGQGSITHMAYSGVTLGLLHGSMPDMLLMCHESSRKEDVFGHPIYDVKKSLKLYLDLVRIFKPCECVGLSLITYKEEDSAARKAIKSYESEYGIPAADIIRFGGNNIEENIETRLNKAVRR